MAPVSKGWRLLLFTPCKPGQVWVGLSRSDLFDPEALASLKHGRISKRSRWTWTPDFIGPNLTVPG
jgi:D-3-phosphoglycerate dehydrogenase